MSAPSIDDFINDFRAQAQLLESQLQMLDSQISLMYAEGGAVMADRLTGYAAGLAKSTFLDGASGDDLTTVADDRWGIQRQGAVQASVIVTFSRASGAAGGGTIPAGFTVATVRDAQGNEVRFTTDAPAVFVGAALSVSGISAHATAGGIAGNVGASTVTRMIDAAFDPSITVTNPAGGVGGAEEESDDALRERVRAFPTTIRRGTLSALQYGALTVAGVAVATAVEDSTGLVTVYVTDASGNSNSTMAAAVATELENWRAAGSLVQIVGGAVFVQAVAVVLTLRAGVSGSLYAASIQAAVTALLAKLVLGQTLYLTAIKAAVRNIDPDNILDVSVPTPGANVVPAANQVIRAGTVSSS